LGPSLPRRAATCCSPLDEVPTGCRKACPESAPSRWDSNFTDWMAGIEGTYHRRWWFHLATTTPASYSRQWHLILAQMLTPEEEDGRRCFSHKEDRGGASETCGNGFCGIFQVEAARHRWWARSRLLRVGSRVVQLTKTVRTRNIGGFIFYRPKMIQNSCWSYS
jgi:hypothetical protein